MKCKNCGEEMKLTVTDNKLLVMVCQNCVYTEEI